MLNALIGKKQETNASARVVDGKLILSLPDATSPVVWQMDLAQAKSSALEVVHDEDANTYTLMLKTQKGETVTVAPFAQRTHAVEGLMAASRALENAHGQIRGAQDTAANDTKSASAAPTNSNTESTKMKWVSALAAVLVLGGLVFVWSSIMPVPVSTGPIGGASSTASVANPQSAAGVPVSADDYLRGQ